MTLLAWIVWVARLQAEGNLQTIHGQRPTAMESLRPLAPLAPTNQLNLVLSLPLRQQAALGDFLHDLYNPASPCYRKYLTPSQFAERFGPAEQDYREVVRFATSHGLTVAGTHPNRTLLEVKGSVANVEKALHVRMGVYQHPTEARTFYAPDSDPSPALAVPLLAIEGLDNFTVPRPMNLRLSFDVTNYTTNAFGSGPNGDFLGYDFRAAYAPGVALTGAGQTIGLLEFDGYYASDIAAYENLAKLPNVPLTNILLDGASGTPGANSIEPTLDIEMTVCMAPGLSSIIVYEGEVANDILNRMATDNLARQLCCCWGNFVKNPARDQIFEQFAAQGQTFFQAAGDNGAYATGSITPPTDDPNITVVGGTVLTTSGPGGAWLAESAWSGGGGGISVNYPLPTWQQGLSTPANQGSASFRNMPDVSAHAGDSVWVAAFNGMQGAVGGTSASTPLWTGFAALANQQAATQGLPAIGFINPTLSAIGLGASYASALHDITNGNNTDSASPTNFFATPGYDLCTGWGTPFGINLINALVSPNSLMAPTFQSAVQANGMLVLTWISAAGQSYQLQSTANLAPATWTNVGGLLTATNSSLGVSCPIGSAAQQFYRIVTEP